MNNDKGTKMFRRLVGVSIVLACLAVSWAGTNYIHSLCHAYEPDAFTVSDSNITLSLDVTDGEIKVGYELIDPNDIVWIAGSSDMKTYVSTGPIDINTLLTDAEAWLWLADTAVTLCLEDGGCIEIEFGGNKLIVTGQEHFGDGAQAFFEEYLKSIADAYIEKYCTKENK